MTTVAIKDSISGLVSAPSSKSVLQRLLICSALSGEETSITASGFGEDVVAVALALSALGAGIEKTGERYFVRPIQSPPSTAVINCRESGAALRFLLPLACALGIQGAFTGEGRLNERPILHLIRAMEANGGVFSAGTLPFTVSGRLKAGEYRLPAGISSQYLSGLLMALPLLDGDSRVVLENGPLVSAPYVDMTVKILHRFGVEIEKNGDCFIVKGGQKFASPGALTAPGDWSAAAPLLCAGALVGKVLVSGLQQDGLQADEAVLGLLSAFGAKAGFSQGMAFCEHTGRMQGIETDLTNCPDLLPSLAVVAAGASGVTVFSGVGRLRHKESDRPGAIVKLLTDLGGRASAEGDKLTVWGTGLGPGRVSAQGDHRIAMAAAVSGGPVEIDGGASVNKSYPGFFNALKDLGYKIKFDGR